MERIWNEVGRGRALRVRELRVGQEIYKFCHRRKLSEKRGVVRGVFSACPEASVFFILILLDALKLSQFIGLRVSRQLEP
jgi:hypothetical protein